MNIRYDDAFKAFKCFKFGMKRATLTGEQKSYHYYYILLIDIIVGVRVVHFFPTHITTNKNAI